MLADTEPSAALHGTGRIVEGRDDLRRVMEHLRHLPDDRRDALIVLRAELPVPAMLTSLAGNAALSVARILFFLVAKRPEAARDGAAACPEQAIQIGETL